MNVHQALTAVMRDVQAVGKDSTNEAQGFRFRGIDGVVNAVGPALRDHGVIVTPKVLAAVYEVVEVGRNRTRMRQATLQVRYRFFGPEGDHLDAVTYGEAMDAGDKATTKAMSAAFKYALVQALCIPTHEPDADAATHERSAAPPVAAPARRSELMAVIAELDDTARGEVKAFMATENIPSLKRSGVTEEQADALEWKVATLTPAPEPVAVAELGPPVDEPCVTCGATGDQECDPEKHGATE